MSEREPFRPALVVGLIVAGLISFAAYIALLGWGEPLDESRERGTGAVPTASAIGFKGVMDLTGRFYPVRAVTQDSDFSTDELLVVPLRPDDSAEDVRRLLRRRSGLSTLLILPKWHVVRDRDQPRWVRSFGRLPPSVAGALLGPGVDVVTPAVTPGTTHAASFGLAEIVEAPLPREPQAIEGENIEMLVGLPGRGALVAQLGQQPHFVVADPDLLNNYGLRTPEGARAAVDLLAVLQPLDWDGIVFATSVKGPEAASNRNLIRSMFEPPFLAMTIALILTALLAGLYGAFRFGPVRRPVRAIPLGKAALVENSAGLVRFAGREVRLGGGYADLIRDEAARGGAVPPHLQGEALEAYLDRFSRPGEPSFRQLAWNVRAASTKAELIAAARALFKWKKEMIR